MSTHVKPKGRLCSHARYRMSCTEYDALVDHAGNRCQLCCRTGPETGHGYLVIDHDAHLGNWAVRGLLCSRCNLLIEYAQIDSAAAEAYLNSPWHARHPIPPLDEPPVGSFIRAGRRRFERTLQGWEPRDRLKGSRLSWDRLASKYVRRIARDNGIEAARPGPKAKK
ncbi:endonuclease domain-containing protein [Streptomyces sp. NPDC051994]|uniref:endonuclease domain-containing protein n=1 Tax=unclassified Streptomyces TaxID=2593676 RepID=UPI0034374A3A